MVEKYTLQDYTKSSRLFPGGVKTLFKNIVVGPLGVATLFEVAGKGAIAGGWLYQLNTSTAKASEPVIHIDGVKVAEIGYAEMNDIDLSPPANYIFRILKFDDINFKYTIDFSAVVAFEKSIKMTIFNDSLTDASVASVLAYYLH